LLLLLLVVVVTKQKHGKLTKAALGNPAGPTLVTLTAKHSRGETAMW
jgi:hypothetical protein